MSYKETVACLFDNESFIRNHVLIEQHEYMEIWNKIATGKRMNSRNYVGASRRDKCLWEILENAVNSFMRKVSIVERNDEIQIALDDDKIWLQNSGKNDEDHFGL